MKEKTVMKKLMSMILALMMALSLVACGDKGGSGDNGDSASKPEHTDTTTVAVGAVILARDDVAEDDVYKFVADIFDNAADLVTSHAKYGELSLEYGASIIALVAIFKSFFGHYLGTLEGLNGLILKFGYKGDKKKVSVGKLNTISMIFIMGSTWVVAYANPNILDLIEAMGAPIIASLLCLLPMYAIRKAPALAKYKGRTENIFVTAVGLLTILNIVYKLF